MIDERELGVMTLLSLLFLLLNVRTAADVAIKGKPFLFLKKPKSLVLPKILFQGLQ